MNALDSLSFLRVVKIVSKGANNMYLIGLIVH